MGLRCSLLGHEYDDVTVERDREERGNEVVIAEREVEECARCGAERVVSENTEVRSLESESDPTGGAEPDSARASDRASASTAGPDADPTGVSSSDSSGPAESIREAEPSADRSEPSSGHSATAGGDAEPTDADAADGLERPASPEKDDAVILDDEGDDEEHGDRDRGQWPDAEDTRQDEQTPTGVDGPAEQTPTEGEGTAEQANADSVAGDAPPDADASQQPPTPADASAGEGDDGEVLDADAGRDAAAEEAATAWPEHEGDDEGFAAEPDESEFQFGGESLDANDIQAAAESASAGSADGAEAETGAKTETGAEGETEFVEGGSGITAAGPFEETETDTIQTELVCPECGLERDAAGSSLRAGDICPECRRGYLAER